MMKNALYFMLKELFALTCLIMLENDLIRKVRLISKFMTQQPWKQIIAIHISPNISRSNLANIRLDEDVLKTS